VDDIVKQAMAKWPSVPAVYGWLALDRRGTWLIKGDPVSNPVIAAFIGRNYARDTEGRWFFQNGPQRVFAALEYTPLVYRLASQAEPCAPLRVESHTGTRVTAVNGAWIDDDGALLLSSDLGPGLVDDRDLDRLLPCFTDAGGEPLADETIADAIAKLQSSAGADLWLSYGDDTVPVTGIAACDVPRRFGFVQQPAQREGADQCT
jgi:hypothetical protein